jgi:hypothetical protein
LYPHRSFLTWSGCAAPPDVVPSALIATWQRPILKINPRDPRMKSVFHPVG